MKSKVAVITQALSSGSYFPAWYKYYSKHIGCDNIFIITQGISADEFSQYPVGGLYKIPDLVYDENQRVRMNAKQVDSLLEHYETVFVVDSDEILVAGEKWNYDLSNFLENSKNAYVTAIGLELFQMPGEGVLNIQDPILIDQRNTSYLNSSLCKTAVTRTPLRWGVGYHFCSVYPRFDDLYLYHLKRSDRDMQINWLRYMSKKKIPTQQIQSYFSPEEERIDKSIAEISKRPYRNDDKLVTIEFQLKFLSKIALDVRDGIYRGEHFVDTHLQNVPINFKGTF